MNLRQKIILVLEDDQDLRDIMVEIIESTNLKDFCLKAVSCGDGEAGLNLAKEKKFDLIVTDLIMPSKGANSFIPEIRSEKSLNNKTPMIVVSGFPHEEKLVGEQYDYFIEKPFTAEKLQKALKIFISDSR